MNISHFLGGETLFYELNKRANASRRENRDRRKIENYKFLCFSRLCAPDSALLCYLQEILVIIRWFVNLHHLKSKIEFRT